MPYKERERVIDTSDLTQRTAVITAEMASLRNNAQFRACDLQGLFRPTATLFKVLSIPRLAFRICSGEHHKLRRMTVPLWKVIGIS
jgi:hypothetical protein